MISRKDVFGRGSCAGRLVDDVDRMRCGLGSAVVIVIFCGDRCCTRTGVRFLLCEGYRRNRGESFNPFSSEE